MSAQKVMSVEDLPLNLAEAEGLLVKRALAETGGNISKAARLLGVNRMKIYRILAKTSKPKIQERTIILEDQTDA